MHPWTIRRANLKDDSELRAIAEVDVTIPAIYDADFVVNEEAVSKQAARLKEMFKEEDFFNIAINGEGKIIGYHAVKKQPYMNDLFAGNIYTLWVHPDFRNRGLAWSFKKSAEAWAKEQKLDHIFTWVHANNKGMIELNKNLGYEVVNYKMKKKIE